MDELKTLVASTLESKGVLAKIRVSTNTSCRQARRMRSAQKGSGQADD